MEATADVRQRIEAFRAERYPDVSAKALAIFDKEFRAIWNKPDSERRPEDEPIIALMKLQVDGAAEGFASKLKGKDKDDWSKLQVELASVRSLEAEVPAAGAVWCRSSVRPLRWCSFRTSRRWGRLMPGFLSVIDSEPADDSDAG